MKCSKCQFDNPDSTNFCGKCGTKLAAFDDDFPSVTKTLKTPIRRLETGSIFAARYEVLGELGKGGMGEVYRVKDQKLDEEMALKVLKPEIAAHKETIERFKNELKFARKIAHRNVCKMYDLNEEEDILYITMEYVKGKELKSYIGEKAKLTKEEAITIARQVCEGLAEAHDLGVVHRDLKPQNIMIDEKGQTKIMDFGIARSIEAPGVTQTGMMIGTPDYISPEQAEGERADQRSDIYSLGVILYEMVTGRVPFKGDTALSVAIKHKTHLPPDPRKLNPELSEDLARLILRCMEKDAGRRYQTARELSSDLDKIEKGIPIGKAIPVKKRLEIKWTRVLIYGGAALLLVLLIVAALFLFRPRISSIAVLPFKNLTGDAAQEYFTDGITDGLIMHLGRIGALRVISFWSTQRYKGGEKPLSEISRELNVDALVEGTVQQVGGSVGIRVRLIKAVPEEQNLWEGTYDRSITDVLFICSDVARAIGQEIKIRLNPQEEKRLSSARQVNPETYKSYLKGMSYLTPDAKEEDIKEGLGYLQQAVEKDPTDPLAYTGLAYGYVSLGHSPASPPDAWQRAREAAQRAVKLDPDLAEGYANIADVKLYYERDWKGAEENFLRAGELNPNLAMNHYHYAWYLDLMGHLDKAIAEHKRAQELDPLTPLHTGWLAQLYYKAGQYDKGFAEAKKCIGLRKDESLGWHVLGLGYARKGMYDEAIAAQRKAVEINPLWKHSLGRAYALAGREDEARKILAELEKAEPNAWVAWGLANLYAALGEKDKAFQALTFEPSHAFVPWFSRNARFIAWREDPRFKDLLRKYNLPE